MKKACHIVFIIGAIIGFLVFTRKVSVGSYSMSLSYYMLLPAIMFLDELLDKFSIRVLLSSMIALLIILALGARGPVLCTIVFVVLKLIRPGIKLNYRRTFAYSGIFAVGILGYLSFNKIFEIIYNLLLNFGIKSRSISLFLKDSIHLSGRDRLYEIMLEKIYAKPILGIGLAGDRVVLGGGYVHNIFLELIANFGVLAGGIIICMLILAICKLLATKNKETYNMIIIWIGLGFVKLMVSSSYLISINFWFFLGLCCNALFVKRRNKMPC